MFRYNILRSLPGQFAMRANSAAQLYKLECAKKQLHRSRSPRSSKASVGDQGKNKCSSVLCGQIIYAVATHAIQTSVQAAKQPATLRLALPLSSWR